MSSIKTDERKELERLRRFKEYLDKCAVSCRWSDGIWEAANEFFAERYQKAVAAMDKEDT